MRDGWIETTLGEVSESSWGNTEITKSKYVPTGFLAFSASGADGFLDWFEHDTSAVILSAIGAQCGKTWFASGKWTAIKNTIWLKSNGISLSDKYLFYLSNTEHFWQIRGQAQPFISLGDVKKKKLLLPPLVEQKRIVDLISSVDSYIEALQQQVDKARKSRNAVLHDLLAKGGKDWVEITLEELISHSIGGIWGEEPGNSEIDVSIYRQTEFTDAGILVTPAEAVRSITKNQLNSRTLQFGDILIQKSAGTPSLPGRVVMVQDLNGEVASFSNFLNLLRPDTTKCLPRIAFLFFWLKHKEGKAFEYQRGTNIKNLDLPSYLQEKVNLPPLPEQKRIVELISVFDNQIEVLDSTIAKTKNLRSALLSSLLSGNHEIPTTYDKLIGAA
jgi:restriction endonuclease S subunit